MTSETFWNAFSQTGDPMLYLLYRTSAVAEEKNADVKIRQADDRDPDGIRLSM